MQVPDLIEDGSHHIHQTGLDLVGTPEEALQILDPFEGGDGDAAGVGQDVGQHHDAAFQQDGLGFGGGATVGAFGYEPVDRLVKLVLSGPVRVGLSGEPGRFLDGNKLCAASIALGWYRSGS